MTPVATPTNRATSAAAALRADGYTLLPAFLDPAELAEADAEVEKVHSKPADPSCVRANNTLLPLRWSDRLVGLVLASTRRVALLSEALGAEDIRWISGYVSSKAPCSGPLAWHQDWWGWDHPVSLERRPVQVAVLCYLTATDSHSGALRVLPGSHLRSTPLHGLVAEAHEDEHTADGLEFDDIAGQQSLPLSPGDAVVLDYRLLHGTHANVRNFRRDALLLSFTPSWRDVPDEVRAHLISHPAQPSEKERPEGAWTASLLPHYTGTRRDLKLNRVPPANYNIV